MREYHFENNGESPTDANGIMTIDAVGESIVMPKGARAWCQWSAFNPRRPNAKARVWWLVASHRDGSAKPYDPFSIEHGQHGAFELPVGTVAVQIGLEGVPPGFAFAAHLDGIGHAV